MPSKDEPKNKPWHTHSKRLKDEHDKVPGMEALDGLEEKILRGYGSMYHPTKFEIGKIKSCFIEAVQLNLPNRKEYVDALRSKLMQEARISDSLAEVMMETVHPWYEGPDDMEMRIVKGLFH